MEVTSVEVDTIVIDVASMVVVSALVVVASVVAVSTPVVTSVEAERIVELSTEDSEAKAELVDSNPIKVVDATVGSLDAGPGSISLFSSDSKGELTQRPGLADTCVCDPEAGKTKHCGVKNTGTHGNPMKSNAD